MTLSDRLRAARGDAAPPKTSPDTPGATPPGTSTGASGQSGPPGGFVPVVAAAQVSSGLQPAITTPPAPSALPEPDALITLKERASAALFERVGARLNNPSLTEDQLHSLVRTELNKVVEDETVPLTAEQRLRLISDIQDDVLGHGPLERLLADPTVTEIMVNGPDMIYIEQRGRLTRSSARFTSEEHLRQVIERIVSRIGRRIDESSPLVDARLADGSRVNAVIPPLAVNGSSLTIRKFSKDPFKVNDLIGFGTLTPEMAELLRACVQARLNIIVSGGTGSGKTTLLNVLSSFIPESERIVTIEDAVELQMQQDHVVRLEARPANI
ncbi:MAG: ATPase, T2SS/T4P/T4SS family, partial [Dietzia sp.]